jgi:DNA repair exonuclease SbcCD ATPase subunit
MLNINYVEFKNLLSFGNTLTRIDFNSFDSLLITGSNGGGKSSLLVESIYYAFYGKPYRNIRLDALMNNINKKDLYVKIDFNVGINNYVIERGLEPSILVVKKNGIELKQDVGKLEFQKSLNKIIGADGRIFNQIALADSLFYKPFMALNSFEKRYIIDNIFGLDIITKMQEKIKEYRVKIEDIITTKNVKIEILQEKILLNKEFANKQKTDEINRINSEIDKNKVVISSNESIINKNMIHVDEKNESYKALVLEKEKKSAGIKMLVSRIKDLEYEIKSQKLRINLLKLGKCDKCDTTLPTELANKEIPLLESCIYTNTADREKLKSEQDVEENLLTQIEQSINILTQEISALQKDIFNSEKSTKIMQKEIQQLMEKLSAISTTIGFVKLCPCVQTRKHQLDRRNAFLRMNGNRNPTSIITNRDRSISVQGHFNA